MPKVSLLESYNKPFLLFPDIIQCRKMKNTLRTSFTLIVSQILVFIIYSLGKANLMNVLL